uniref:Thyroid peroxidase n=1 Tax=Panagrolaimus sp. JU765 TaxID=591449 RepID=A0AC34R0Q7_9BILA
MPFRRLLSPIYENGFNTPVGWDPDRLYFGFKKPNPRSVSLELVGTPTITPHHRFSAMLMQWGQFLDHDITFFATALARQTYMTGAICNKTCENVDPCFNIPLPLNDPKRREHRHMKYPCIEFERSAAICGSGETSPIFQQVTHREQVNIITAFIDGSNVYGSTEVDALDLRDLFSDHGLLRFDIVSSSQKPYMPFEKDSGMDCRRNRSVANPIRCFLAGDFRANEQLGLTAMHTLWFREHNRIASKLLEMNADWDGERIYQETRKIIGGMMQHITFKHWLPLILGQDGYERWIGEYKGYDSNVDPSISNEFATAAFRFGHTLINPRLERLGKNFETISSGPIMLHEAFFAPERMLSEGGIDPLLRGLFASPLKKPLSHQLLNKELTEKLFHRATDVALDLAAMNIQRGRDHALPGYVEYRRFCNLSVPESWEQLELDFEDQTIISKLRKLYGHPGNLDLWVGGVLEKRLPDALM